jgi:ABC-type multidrug transport system ATPase subunit
VREHLLFYARLKGIPPHLEKSHVDSSLSQYGLLDVQKRKARELSGGMQRRLCVAISLVGNPKIVFLDEPVRYSIEISSFYEFLGDFFCFSNEISHFFQGN